MYMNKPEFKRQKGIYSEGLNADSPVLCVNEERANEGDRTRDRRRGRNSSHSSIAASSGLVEGGPGTLRWTGRGWEEPELAKPAVSSREGGREGGSWCSLCQRLVRVKRNQWGTDWRHGTDTVFFDVDNMGSTASKAHVKPGKDPRLRRKKKRKKVCGCVLRVFSSLLVTNVVLAFSSIINCSKNPSRCHGVTFLESGWVFSLPFLPHCSH